MLKKRKLKKFEERIVWMKILRNLDVSSTRFVYSESILFSRILQDVWSDNMGKDVWKRSHVSSQWSYYFK